jgi:hypothetical protein
MYVAASEKSLKVTGDLSLHSLGGGEDLASLRLDRTEASRWAFASLPLMKEISRLFLVR